MHQVGLVSRLTKNINRNIFHNKEGNTLKEIKVNKKNEEDKLTENTCVLAFH